MRRAPALVALWLSIQYWALGPFSAVVVHDNADCTLPQWLALARAGSGAAARWMPWSMAGFDRLANDYPLDQPLLWAFFVLPGWLAWGVLLFLHSFVAAWGMRRLCLDALETSEEAAAAAAAAFAVSLARSYIFKNAWGYALVPAALWAFDRLVHERRAFGFGRAVASSAAVGGIFGLFSSGPLTLPFTLAAVPVWLWLRRVASARSAACAAAFMGAAIAARWPVFLAMWAEAPLSHRAGAVAEQPAFFARLASLAVEGVVELAPAVGVIAAGAWSARGRSERLGRFVGVSGAFLVAPALVGVAVSLAGDRLGFLKGFSFDRFGSLLPLWVALSAALAYDLIPEARKRRARAVLCGALFVWSLGPKIVDAKEWYFGGSYAALFSAPSVRAVAATPSDGPFRVVTVPHGVHPAYANAYGLEAADGYANLYPARYRRFWAEVIAPVLDADPTYRRDLLHWGNRVYLFLRSAPAPGEPLAFAGRWRLDLLSLAGARFVFSRLELSDPSLRLVRRGTRPEDGTFRERLARRLRRNFGGDDGLFVYENPAALPRAFVVPRAAAAASADEAFALLRAADAKAFRSRAVVENLENPPPPGRGYFVPRIVSRTPDRLELDLTGAGPGMLVVTDPWSPRRVASIDGWPEPVLPAWGAFQAVALRGPAKRLILTYGPVVSRENGGKRTEARIPVRNFSRP